MRQRALTWLAICGGWTALALLFAISSSLTYLSTGRPANWRLTIGRALAEWWLWALLTPLVVWLARRFRLDGPRVARNLTIHVAAGLTLAFAKTLADRAAFAMMTGFWIYILASTLALHFVIYTGIVAAAHGFEYYRRSREREMLERRLAETRLQLLGMQLQPHFLFNTLNTIAELVHHDPDTADDMIVGLSDLLRLTLDLESRQQITLGEELTLLSKYLEIQRARFGGRLQVTIDADAAVESALVPVLLLQPIVENSIRHGVARRSNAGRIAITARGADARLVIEVRDDGTPATTDAPATRAGVGLTNTRARLETLYGSGGTVSLEHRTDGTCVTIQMPLQRGGTAA